MFGPTYQDDYSLLYAKNFAYRFSWTFFYWGFLALGVTFLLYAISLLLRKTIKKPALTSVLASHRGDEEEINLNVDSSLTEIRLMMNEDKKERKHLKSILVQVFEILAQLGSWTALYLICFAFTIISGLTVISYLSCVLIILSLFTLKFITMIFWYCPTFLRQNKSSQNSWAQSLLRKVTITTKLFNVRFSLVVGLALVSSFTMPLLTAGTCMNYFNEGYGTKIQGLGMSTRLTRYFELDTVCPQGKICHLYATLPEDSATGVILNVHTGSDVSSITVGYKEDGDDQPITKQVVSQSYLIDLEGKGDRYMHSAYLSNLSPNTTYYFEVSYNGKVQKNGTYLTLPDQNLQRNIVLATGGDAGTSAKAKNMTIAVGKYKPDAIMVGGDLAYDNGLRACYYSWDLFLWMFESLNDKMGRVVPLMFSIGNHDLGFNAMQDVKIDITKNLYYIFFPQESKKAADGTLLPQVPALEDRLSYNYHTLGNTIHFALDSGYMKKYAGDQVDFMSKVIAQNLDKVKVANFHVPMYPVCYDSGHDQSTVESSTKYWAPIFEQFKFASVFENHKHLYKKSFPLKNGTVQKPGQGVEYFGDGNWGININACWKTGTPNGNRTGVLETWGDTNHVWIMQIQKENLTYFAINKSGKIFDKKYYQQVNDYL